MAGMRKLKGKWYIRVYLGNGKEKLLPTKTGDRKQAEAKRRLIEEREFLVKARLIEDIDKVSSRLFDLVDEFLKECRSRLRSSTVESYDYSLVNLKACWGNLELGQLTARHLSMLREYLLARVIPLQPTSGSALSGRSSTGWFLLIRSTNYRASFRW